VCILSDTWLLTPQRIAVHLPSATAVVADLHLGYDAVRRRLGEAVPMRDLSAFVAPLLTALKKHTITRLVVAGDLVEEGRSSAAREFTEEFHDRLRMADVELVGIVPGNHDRGLGDADGLPLFADGVQLGDWLVVHGDRTDGEGCPIVQGHEHPFARWSSALGAPCYLVTSRHLVLPAYSPDAAGVNVIGSPRWGDHRCLVIVGDEVLDFGPVKTLKQKH
jgi:uncharacterized protein